MEALVEVLRANELGPDISDYGNKGLGFRASLQGFRVEVQGVC